MPLGPGAEQEREQELEKGDTDLSQSYKTTSKKKNGKTDSPMKNTGKSVKKGFLRKHSLLEKVTFFLDKDDESVSYDIKLSEMTLQKIFSCALVRRICDMGKARGGFSSESGTFVVCIRTSYTRIWSRKLLLQKVLTCKKVCVPA